MYKQNYSNFLLYLRLASHSHAFFSLYLTIAYVERIMELSNFQTLPNSADTYLQINYLPSTQKKGRNQLLNQVLPSQMEWHTFLYCLHTNTTPRLFQLYCFTANHLWVSTWFVKEAILQIEKPVQQDTKQTCTHSTNRSQKTQTVAPSLLSPPTSERCWVLRRSALNILWLQYFYVLVWFSSGFNFLDFSQINWFFSLSCTVGFVFCYVFCFVLFFRCALSYPPLFIILYSVENELALTEFFGNTSDNFSELQGKSWRLTPSRHS